MEKTPFPTSKEIIPHLTKPDITFNQMRILLASAGWDTNITIGNESRRQRGEFRIQFKHPCWHETLASVNLFVDYRLTDSVEQDTAELMKIMRDKTAELTTLYDNWVDKVPMWVTPAEHIEYLNLMGKPIEEKDRWESGRWLINQSETEYLRNYPSTRVTSPERASPVFMLPGWSECLYYTDITDFIENSENDTGLYDLLAKYSEIVKDRQVSCQIESDLVAHRTFNRVTEHFIKSSGQLKSMDGVRYNVWTQKQEDDIVKMSVVNSMDVADSDIMALMRLQQNINDKRAKLVVEKTGPSNSL